MVILSKDVLKDKLYGHYLANYGECASDVWFDAPAVNVIVFKRDNKLITLKAHILTGEIDEYEEIIRE